MNYEFELLVQRVAELESGAKFLLEQSLKATKICIEQEKVIGEILNEVQLLRSKISELEARLVGVYQGNTYVFPPPIQLIADTPETHVKLPPQS